MQRFNWQITKSARRKGLFYQPLRKTSLVALIVGSFRVTFAFDMLLSNKGKQHQDAIYYVFLMNQISKKYYWGEQRFFQASLFLACSLWSSDVATVCGLPRLIWKTYFFSLKQQANSCMLCIFLVLLYKGQAPIG